MFEFTLGSLKKDFLLYSELVWNLDNDNSNFAHIELFGKIFTYKNINITGYGKGLIFESSFDGISIPCFSILEGKEQKQFKKGGRSKDKIVLYSSFFVLNSLQKLPFTINEFIGTLFNYDNALLYRIDICVDVPYTIKDLIHIFADIKKPSSAIGTDKKHPEFYQTYYIGEIQSSKNRNSIIRIYDKVLDTWKKHKAFLYPHLHKNSDVRRIELELRPEQAKRYHNYSILDLLDNKDDVISAMFAEYLNKKTPELYHLKKGILNFKIFQKRAFDLKKAFLDFGHIPKDYLKRSYGYLKNILQNTGYNGLFQLLFNSEYSDIFLQKNIKSCVNNILDQKSYNLMVGKNIITNQDNKINSGYDFLDNLIIFLKENKNISDKKLNTKLPTLILLHIKNFMRGALKKG
ncbi:MAG: hypothetical protein Q9M97_05435, partial [Candidatus Gracilibacteria bacterium]|nr:hypothetical protein [Candidatus Gracilibacteria bacterium]